MDPREQTLDCILRQATTPHDRTWVMIESLNPLFMEQPFSLTFTTLKKHLYAKMNLTAVVQPQLLPADMFPDIRIEQALSTLFAATLTVANSRRYTVAPDGYHLQPRRNYLMQEEDITGELLVSTDNDPSEGLLRFEHRKPSGKILSEVKQYVIERVHEVPVVHLIAPSSTSKNGNATASAAAKDELDVSFNLMLTEKQTQDRQKVALPFMRAQQQQQQSEAVIHYQPEDADDFDEEDDPDMDLEI